MLGISWPESGGVGGPWLPVVVLLLVPLLLGVAVAVAANAPAATNSAPDTRDIVDFERHPRRYEYLFIEAPFSGAEPAARSPGFPDVRVAAERASESSRHTAVQGNGRSGLCENSLPLAAAVVAARPRDLSRPPR